MCRRAPAATSSRQKPSCLTQRTAEERELLQPVSFSFLTAYQPRHQHAYSCLRALKRFPDSRSPKINVFDHVGKDRFKGDIVDLKPGTGRQGLDGKHSQIKIVPLELNQISPRGWPQCGIQIAGGAVLGS